MTDSSPPKNGEPRVGRHTDAGQNNGGSKSRYSNIPVTVERQRWQLVSERFQRGLLIPFRCSRCGTVNLDPLGRNGKRAWLCSACAAEAEVRPSRDHQIVRHLSLMNCTPGLVWPCFWPYRSKPKSL
jgi:hypothetical protein